MLSYWLIFQLLPLSFCSSRIFVSHFEFCSDHDDQLFFEPVMCVRFGIKCLDFDISRASIEMDRLIQGSVGLQTKDFDTCFASVPFQLSLQPSANSDPRCRSCNPTPLDLRRF